MNMYRYVCTNELIHYYVCIYLDDTELDEFGSEANQFVRIDVRLFRSLVPAEYRIHHTTARENSNTSEQGTQKCNLFEVTHTLVH